MIYQLRTIEPTIIAEPKLIKIELLPDNLNNVIYKDINNQEDYYVYITHRNTSKRVVIETSLKYPEYRVIIDKIHTGLIVDGIDEDTNTLLWRLYVAVNNVEVLNYEKTQENLPDIPQNFNVRLKITGYFSGGYNV